MAQTRKPKERYAELLDVAGGIFAAKGFQSATLQDIADELGMLKGSLYYYIKGKDDLLYEVIESMLDAMLPQIEEWRSHSGPALDALRDFIGSYVQHAIQNRRTIILLTNEVDNLSTDRREAIVRKQRSYIDIVLNLIKQGQQEGSMNPDLDPMVATRAIFGMATSIALWAKPEGHLSTSDIAGIVTQMAGNAMLPAT
ncbi:MAG TPA: TetR/AcrR family transcriptional regulator [Microbacteriaceae bacterium]|nr:TetR/AcrR family transcriptional regulator [Microbacteriaceae bacterium]